MLADFVLSNAWEERVKELVENVYNVSVEEFVQCKLLGSEPCVNDIILSIIPYVFNTVLSLYFIDLSDDSQVFLLCKCRQKVYGWLKRLKKVQVQREKLPYYTFRASISLATQRPTLSPLSLKRKESC